VAAPPAVTVPGAIKNIVFFLGNLDAMSHNPDIPGLLEQYMEDSGQSEQWITVKDIRMHFQLAETDGPAISGFLSKIHNGPFFSCRYKVTRIEKFQDTAPPYRIIKRYLVGERPLQRMHRNNLPKKNIR
jgi:hypothetical protein